MLRQKSAGDGSQGEGEEKALCYLGGTLKGGGAGNNVV